MNRRYARIRLNLLLALSLAAATAGATPPPNFSDRVPLCNLKLNALVNISFGQTTSTATVQATAQPVKVNPYAPGGYTPYQSYTLQTEAATRIGTNPWSSITNTGNGVVGVTTTPVSSGNSTFKNANCQIKGVVTIHTLCPPESGMISDGASIERTWDGCGV